MKMTQDKMSSPWRLGGHSGIVLAFSLAINILGLVGAVYMMQVYDRVLSSGSVSTLIGLSIIALILYLLYGALDYLRTGFLSARGEDFADQSAPKAFRAALDGYTKDDKMSDRRRSLEDIATIRSFLTSRGYMAIFDVIWMPIFLLFIFSLHIVLGLTALIATLGLAVIAIVNERSSRKRIKSEVEAGRKTRHWLSQIHRHAHVVTANGMDDAMAKKWLAHERESRTEAMRFSAVSSRFSVSSKTLRMILQSAILGLGGYLAIKGEISPGAMIAASIIFARTLAPVEQLLSNFPKLIRARQAWSRMKSWVDMDIGEDRVALPAPHKSLAARFKALVPPGGTQPVLQAVQINLKAGDVLGILGPSGGGKTSLTKALSGVWVPEGGNIVLDGADYRDWPRDQFGKAIGYMSQDCQFFDGTIAENICGFKEAVDDADILEAATLAGAHEMILGLHQGYNTQVGPSGVALSAGQKQRINFARALFGDPFIVVLDEPNSNLDKIGEAALAQTVRKLKERGKIVIIVAHRQGILREATQLCMIENGIMKIAGPADAVIKRLKAEERARPAQARENISQKDQRPVMAPPPARQPHPITQRPIAQKPITQRPIAQKPMAPPAMAARPTPAMPRSPYPARNMPPAPRPQIAALAQDSSTIRPELVRPVSPRASGQQSNRVQPAPHALEKGDNAGKTNTKKEIARIQKLAKRAEKIAKRAEKKALKEAAPLKKTAKSPKTSKLNLTSWLGKKKALEDNKQAEQMAPIFEVRNGVVTRAKARHDQALHDQVMSTRQPPQRRHQNAH